MIRTFTVFPQYKGYLYEGEVFLEELESGRHKRWDMRKKLELFVLPTSILLFRIKDLERKTQDGQLVQLALSFRFQIQEGRLFFDRFGFAETAHSSVRNYELFARHWMLDKIEWFLAHTTAANLESAIPSFLNQLEDDFYELCMTKGVAIADCHLDMKPIVPQKVSFTKRAYHYSSTHTHSLEDHHS